MLPALLVVGAVAGAAYAIGKLIDSSAKAEPQPLPEPERRRVFVSFDFDHDLDAKTLFVGQARNSKTPFSIVDFSAKEPIPKREWVDMVRERMARSDCVIVLVGQTMASARGVHREVELAREVGRPVFGVYVNGGGRRSRLPKGLPREDVIEWTWDGIADNLDRRSTRGAGKA